MGRLCGAGGWSWGLYPDPPGTGVVPPTARNVGLLVAGEAGPLVPRNVGPLVPGDAGLLVPRNVRLLVARGAGPGGDAGGGGAGRDVVAGVLAAEGLRRVEIGGWWRRVFGGGCGDACAGLGVGCAWPAGAAGQAGGGVAGQ